MERMTGRKGGRTGGRTRESRVDAAGGRRSGRTKRRSRRAQVRPYESGVAELLAAVERNPGDLTVRLALAEAYFRRGEPERALEALEGWSDDKPGEPLTRSRALRLRALACWQNGDLVGAEEKAKGVLAEEQDSLDALYVLCRVYGRLREYEEARPAAERYVEAFRAAFKADVRAEEYTGDYRHLSHVLEILGRAARDRGDIERAIVEFERAITADPSSHEPYLQLADVHRQRGRCDEARAVVERGLKACSQVHELRLLAEMLVARPTVSACMIVKNEEELLPDCLQSIRDWVDEIIVVDTGSDDRTVEIAKEYGAKVFHQAWEGDFAKHRNYSLEQATGDWVLVIDADERFTEGDLTVLRRHLSDPGVRVLAVSILNVGGKYDDLVTFLPSVRLFRRALGLRYEGIVHNQLKIPQGEPVVRGAVTIRHLGYALAPEKLRAKAARTLGLLDRQLAENPDNAFALFNYAQALLGLGAADESTAERIITAATRARELTDPAKSGERHIHLMATNQLALAHFSAGEYEEAEGYARRALELKNDYLDPILLLGHIFLRRGEANQAEEYYRRYLETQAEYREAQERDEIIVVHLRSQHVAWYGRGLAAEYGSDFEWARECYEKVLEGNEEFLDVHSRLGYLHLAAGRLSEAERHFGRQLEIEPESTRALVGQALVLGEYGRERSAELLLTRALEMCRPEGPELVEHALLLWRYDYREQAARFVQAALSGAEITPEVRRPLADLCFKVGQYERSAGLYMALVNDGEADEDIYNDLAGCFFKTGDFVQAGAWYERALALKPFSSTVLRNLGLTRLRLGQVTEALEALEKCLEVAPDQPEILHLVGDLYARQGQHERAIPLYEKCLQRDPGDRLALFGLSECYLSLGHRESALMGYHRLLDLDSEFEPAQRRVQELAEPAGRP